MVLSCNRPGGRGGAGVWGASRPPRARPGDRPGKGARPVHVNLLIAGAAGLLGFFSPCVLPLIPGYISFVSGVSLAELQGGHGRRHLGRVVAATVAFVFGFSVVFTALGASASLVGAFVLRNREILSRLVGMACAFAWTPCIGPVLAAILTLAATTQRAGDGAALLFAYSLGLGVPFLGTAALLTAALGALRRVLRYTRAIEAASGAFLVLMGVALLFDWIYRLNAWILRIFPVRPAL